MEIENHTILAIDHDYMYVYHSLNKGAKSVLNRLERSQALNTVDMYNVYRGRKPIQCFCKSYHNIVIKLIDKCNCAWSTADDYQIVSHI